MSSIGEGFLERYASPDPFQAIWNDPQRLAQALYVHPDGGFMVWADERPVAPNHIMVVAHTHEPVEELNFNEQQAMWALAMVTWRYVNGVLRPNRKVGVAMWGNQVRTGHIHLVPRNLPTDATQWKVMQLTDTARERQLAETRRLLTFPSEMRAVADVAVSETLKRLRGMELPPLPLPGEVSAPGA